MQDAKDKLICQSISKIIILMEALLDSDNNNLSLLKTIILWDENVNIVEPNISQILEIENNDELLLKLYDIIIDLANFI